MELDGATWDAAARSARSGDRDALARLARDVWPSIRRWALLELGDPSLAEDAAQESVVRVIRHLSGWSPDRPFAPWLRAVVRHAARDVRSRRGEVRQAEPEAASEGHPDRGIDLRRAADRALAALATCTPRQREVLDLCDLQGLSPTDAAASLGIAPGTARALLHQARRTLRAELLREDRGEVHSLLVERAR